MTTDTVVQVPEHYNPNQLVTYKVISDGTSTYPTSKVVDIEWQLENARNANKDLKSLLVKTSNLEDMLPGWIENDESAENIVSEICDLFGFNPTKQIEFEAAVTFSGTISVPLKEIADFDINSVDFNVDINSWSHDVEVDSIEVDNVITL